MSGAQQIFAVSLEEEHVMRPGQDQASDRPKKMTYEEFLDWCDADTLAEWVAGEPAITRVALM